jgi:hypothetical protein
MPDPHLICPTCNEEKQLRRSHFRTIDLPNLLFRRRPYRCLICNRRFYSQVQRATEPRAGASSQHPPRS